MFLVETLLNLVIYVRNVHSKNTEAPFPIYYYIYYSGLPLFTWREIQGLFQDLFVEIQDLLCQLKPERYTHFFQNKTLFSFTELADPDNEKQPMTGHFGQKYDLAKSRFLFYSTVVF